MNEDNQTEEEVIPKVYAKKYLVAYLDLLGSKERILNEKDGEQLNAIHSLYFMTLYSIRISQKILNINNIKVKIFSDNIVIAKEITEEIDSVPSALSDVLLFTDMIQVIAFAGSGWLIRGAITIGDLYIDDTLIWGKALLRAYDLEQGVAVYPRIVIDSAVLENLTSKDRSEFMRDFLKLDSDGVIYDNYFNFMLLWGNYNSFWAQYKKLFEEHLKDYPPASSSDKIRQKLFWTAKKYGEAIGDSSFISKCRDLGFYGGA